MPNPNQSELFDFQLDETQEERARRLHRDSMLIDMLFQGPCGPTAFTEEMNQQLMDEYERSGDLEQVIKNARRLPLHLAIRGEFPQYREWWESSGLTAASIGMDGSSFSNAMASIAVLTHAFDAFDWLVKALTIHDIRRAKADGKRAAFINSQNSLLVEQDLDNLDVLYHFGLRVLQLTYNNMNFVGAGCTERTDAGISSFGARLIDRMNDLGIVVDTGHCGRQTTLDAVVLSRTPVIASHTCARAIGDHARGKTDEVLEAIANGGGVIGVVTLPSFLTADAAPTINHFLDHIDYIAKLVGPEHVGIGTDWPLCMPDWCIVKHQRELAPKDGFRPEDRLSTTDTLEGMRDYRQFINITRGLVSRGYADEEIKGMLGGNWLRVLEAVWA
jgi:membrane dipeptidase